MSAGVSMSAQFTAPPQPDEERAFRLARMHLCAFFYWLTYNSTERRGYWWPGDYMMLNAAMRADWGNVWQRGFAKAVVAWEPRLYLRNRNYRLTGFLGERKVAATLVEQFEAPRTHLLYRDQKSALAMRPEIALEDQADIMFVYEGPVVRHDVAT